MTQLAIIARDITDEFGNLLEGAEVTIRVGHGEGGSLAELFSDVSGNTTVTNPVTVADGKLSVYAQPGRYRLEGTAAAGNGSALIDTTPLAGKNYDNRADAVADIADGYTAPDGTVFWAGGRAYRFDAGATAISDMPNVVVVGDVTPEHMPGVTYAARAQAMADYSLAQGVPWRMTGEHDVAGETIKVYTAGDASHCTLITSANGSVEDEFQVLPIPADTSDTDSALLTAANAIITAGEWKRGRKTLPSLAGWAGKAFRLATTDKFIARRGDAGDYRTELRMHVVDDEGNLSHPLPYDIPSTGTTLTLAETEIVRAPMEVKLPHVKVTTGTTERGSVFRIERSNTVLRGGHVENETTTTMQIMARLRAWYACTWYDYFCRGAGETSTNYGMGCSGCGHRIVNATMFDCRRGFDSTNGSELTLENPIAPDGVGGHLVFGLRIIGGTIGVDAPNTAPIHASGSDIVAIGTTLSRNTVGPILNQRQDVVEVRGQFGLINCQINFDLTGISSGGDGLSLVKMDWPVSGTFDPGRDVYFPDHIILTGNRVNVLGTDHSFSLRALLVDDTQQTDSSVIFNTDVDIHSNSFYFENGSPIVRIEGVRRSEWIGEGIRFNVRDLPEMTVYWGATSGHASQTAARATWHVENVGAVNFRTDPEATYKYMIGCDSFTSSDAAGQTTAVGDEEWWHKTKGGSPQQFIDVGDDEAKSFTAGATYATYMVTARNRDSSAFAAQFSIDNAGTRGVTVHWSVNGTVGVYTTALTGTDGADGQFNIGINGGVVYLENRTNDGLPLALVKVQEG